MALRQGFMVETGEDPREAFAFAADRGFDFVELNMEGSFHHTRCDPERIGRLADEFGLDLVAHLPFALDAGSPQEAVRDGACRELEAAIDAAAEMGAGRGVFHATTFAKPDRWPDDRVWDAVVDSVARLHEYGRERDVLACAENLKGPFVDVGDFPALFERTDGVACLDTGHAHATGHGTEWQAEFVREHGDQIAHVHLNDTRRDDTDEHLPVGVGKLDFGDLAAAMVETDWSGTCTHEVYTPDADYENPAQGKARFDELLASA